jgi:hypothetical protein
MMYTPVPDYATLDTRIAFARTREAFYAAVRAKDNRLVEELLGDMMLITEVELGGMR